MLIIPLVCILSQNSVEKLEVAIIPIFPESYLNVVRLRPNVGTDGTKKKLTSVLKG